MRGVDALDIGASTGGFTDCLLQRGAARVIALDVGHGQLHPKLRGDPRVTVLERSSPRRATLIEKIGGTTASRPLFEATAARLPGFVDEAGFVF